MRVRARRRSPRFSGGSKHWSVKVAKPQVAGASWVTSNRICLIQPDREGSLPLTSPNHPLPAWHCPPGRLCSCLSGMGCPFFSTDQPGHL